MTGAEKFLTECVSKKIKVKVYLQHKNIMLEGFVRDFDETTITLDDSCLVSKHNIVSITKVGA